MAVTPSDPATLGQLFMKQVQRQEEAWQRNATYRRQADLVEILEIQKEELSNALRSKADFINTVGQELRTPLTTIKTALTLLNSPSLKPPQRQRYMELIEKECDRQSSLITSLLDLVQLDQAVSPTALESIGCLTSFLVWSAPINRWQKKRVCGWHTQYQKTYQRSPAWVTGSSKL
jgi:signal transduction histidine kinase